MSHCERPDPPVEGGRPRSGDGALLRPAQFPGAPEPLVTHDLIGINSNENGAWVFIEKQKFPTGFWLSLDRGIFLAFFIDPTPTLGVFVSPTLGVFRKFSPLYVGVSARTGGARIEASRNRDSRKEPLKAGPSIKGRSILEPPIKDAPS